MLEHFLSIQLNNGEWYFYKQAKFLVSTFPGKYFCQEYIQELGNLDTTCFDSSQGKGNVESISKHNQVYHLPGL